MQKYKYCINNLKCANCARKIEDELTKNKDLKNVSINFNTATIFYETDVLSQSDVNKLIDDIEPGVTISNINEEIENKKEFHLSFVLIAIALGLLGNILKESTIRTVLFIISYVLLLYKTGFNSIKILIKQHAIEENALITISALGAYFLGQEMEGIMVVSLYTIGRILEAKAINNSRKSISDLMNIKEPYANKLDECGITKVEVETVKIGDILVVKKGEKIPVDGIVIKGSSKLDTSSLTGESEPVKVGLDDKVLSGSVNLSNMINIKVTNTYSDSTVSKILELLEGASERKAKTETLAQKLSKYYTPIIFALAVLVALVLPLVTNLTLHDSLYRALTFLVISCPCAIAISVPLAYFTGIGVASRKGILIKGSNYLDSLSNAKNIIFDKTGTLTNGITRVENINISNKSYKKSELLELLVKGESYSSHPVATAFMKLTPNNLDNLDVENFREFSGRGISYEVSNKKIMVGSKRFCKCDIGIGLHMHINGEHVASININDGIKDGAEETIKKLKKYGLTTYMFTGDRENVAKDVGEKLGIDHVEFEMLPADKFKRFEGIATGEDITIFVGDGINDAPTLKRADIGISMGGVGSDSAIEASDIVLMKDDLRKIPLAIDISRYTKKIIIENLLFALGVKLSVLLLSIFGYANMWMAVFADTGVTLLAVLNTLRIINKFNNN